MAISAGRKFGSIPGVPQGFPFDNRYELSRAKVHRPPQAGISGSRKDGADSIVLNGGYADDEDYGSVIIYTGHGGQNTAGVQIKDQEITDSGNRGLQISFEEQLPVRVVRGPRGDPQWSPKTGYRYDGLYLVSRYWQEYGRNGYKVWRYRLESVAETVPVQDSSEAPVGRTSTIVDRLLRDPSLALRVKALYQYACQVCSVRIESPSGPYAEAAHIRPLGRPDNGPDTASNILCLCPNHHKLLDSGGIIINGDWDVITMLDGHNIGQLKRYNKHQLTQEYIEWHRRRWVG